MVLNFWCPWESLGKLWKVPLLRPHHRWIKSESLEVAPRPPYFLKSHRVIAMCSQGWAPQAQMLWFTRIQSTTIREIRDTCPPPWHWQFTGGSAGSLLCDHYLRTGPKDNVFPLEKISWHFLVPGTVCGAPHMQSYFILVTSQGRYIIFIASSQRRKLRHRPVKWFAKVMQLVHLTPLSQKKYFVFHKLARGLDSLLSHFPS